jgi:rRNA biogenesis protein RRP5
VQVTDDEGTAWTEFVHENDAVKAVIIDINVETKKISLALKPSLFPEGVEDTEDEDDDEEDDDEDDDEDEDEEEVEQSAFQDESEDEDVEMEVSSSPTADCSTSLTLRPP